MWIFRLAHLPLNHLKQCRLCYYYILILTLIFIRWFVLSSWTYSIRTVWTCKVGVLLHPSPLSSSIMMNIRQAYILDCWRYLSSWFFHHVVMNFLPWPLVYQSHSSDCYILWTSQFKEKADYKVNILSILNLFSKGMPALFAGLLNKNRDTKADGLYVRVVNSRRPVPAIHFYMFLKTFYDDLLFPY